MTDKKKRDWPAAAGEQLKTMIRELGAIHDVLRDEIPLPRAENSATDGILRQFKGIRKKLGELRARLVDDDEPDQRPEVAEAPAPSTD